MLDQLKTRSVLRADLPDMRTTRRDDQENECLKNGLLHPTGLYMTDPSLSQVCPPLSFESPAGVAELADALVLGASTERCRGSSPLSCIEVP